MNIQTLHRRLVRRFGDDSINDSHVLIPEQALEMSTTLAGGDFQLAILPDYDGVSPALPMCQLSIAGKTFIMETDVDLIYTAVYGFGEQNDS
jgi:hypothetical protein